MGLSGRQGEEVNARHVEHVQKPRGTRNHQYDHSVMCRGVGVRSLERLAFPGPCVLC